MDILLVAATRFEIEPFLRQLGNKQSPLNRHDIDVLITGVGQVNTTYSLTIKLMDKKPGLVIQAGIAGAFTDRLPLGETVFIRQDAFGDLGTEEKQHFTTIFDAGFADKNEPPFSNGWLINTNTSIFDTSNLKTVNGITINKISDSLLQQQQLVQQFDADAESMEGAAFHYVCLRQQVSFLQIRSISNAVGERDKTKWAMKEAVNNLNNELEKILVNLP